MIVIPAVDLLDHRVVQLVGGVRGTELFSLPNPLDVAHGWISKGAPMLHLVDLDGAFEKKDNTEIICRIARESKIPVQAGGGMSSEDKIDRLLDAGVSRVIVGTRAIQELKWLQDLSQSRPGKIVLAMDVKDGQIAIKGWQEKAPISLQDVFNFIKDLPLAGVLNTNVNVEGQGNGIDRKAVMNFIKDCPHPVIISGGVSSSDDVEFLIGAGANAAVVGVSLYNGSMKPWEWERNWMKP